MHFQYTAYILHLVLSAVIAVLVALYVWERRKTVSGGIALALLALACAVWSLVYALELAGSDLHTKIFWGKIQCFGIVSVPLLWIIFTYSYATQTPRLTIGQILQLHKISFLQTACFQCFFNSNPACHLCAIKYS